MEDRSAGAAGTRRARDALLRVSHGIASLASHGARSPSDSYSAVRVGRDKKVLTSQSQFSSGTT